MVVRTYVDLFMKKTRHIPHTVDSFTSKAQTCLTCHLVPVLFGRKLMDAPTVGILTAVDSALLDAVAGIIQDGGTRIARGQMKHMKLA